MTTQLWAVGLVILDCFIGAFGPIFLKKAAGNFSLNPIKLIKNKNLIIGFTFYALGTIIFIPALKGGDLSVLYPLLSLLYVLVVFYSMWLLKEKMNKLKWLGILFVMIGIAFIGVGSV